MLIVEREDVFAHAWRDLFASQRFLIDVADTGVLASQLLQENHYDIMIVEAAPPQIDAIEFCRSYRSSGGSSPILLTADRHSSETVEKGLDAGADDYLTKPIRLRELTARIRALLRRPAFISAPILQAHDVTLDIEKGAAFVSGKELQLHPMELNLLEFLISHKDCVFTAEALLDRVWHDRSRASVGSVRTHIKTLRQKLHELGADSFITTVRGRGYKVNS